MLTREQVLDELEDLSTVEHALCVEYLFLECALGVAADRAFACADPVMRQLRRVNRALVAAGRGPRLGRATQVRRANGPPLQIAPLKAAQLDGFLEREQAIAVAVDERYAGLPTSFDPADPAPAEDPLAELAAIADGGKNHAAAFSELRTALDGLTPEQYLRARRDEPADDLERGLRAIADAYYALILVQLETGMKHEETLGIFPSVDTMRALGNFHPALFERGLLPAFTLPPA